MSETAANVIIIGSGLAGLTTAYQLLDHGVSDILILDRCREDEIGGQAKESFGGVHFINSPEQRKMKIKDDYDLALRDWERIAQFSDQDHYPKLWAKEYCYRSHEIRDFLVSLGVQFMPVVNWPERGFLIKGNSLPRWHIVWGTGFEIIDRLLKKLNAHPRRKELKILTETYVQSFDLGSKKVIAKRATNNDTQGEPLSFSAKHLVIASGGIAGGDLSLLKKNWNKDWPPPPDTLLNGTLDYTDGKLIEEATQQGAQVTHLDLQWHYPAGIHRKNSTRFNPGISLIPPRSALWLNAHGHRIGPVPLTGNTDSRQLVEIILHQPGQYSWQVMNMKIAKKELAVSGCDYMTAFRYKSKFLLIKNILLGNPELIHRLHQEVPEDVVFANTLDELMDKMDERSLYSFKIDRKQMTQDIQDYDDQIHRGKKLYNDDQLRRLDHFRNYVGDKIRLCKNQPILDKKAGPLIAIREFILSRKTLGGIQTNLHSEIIHQQNHAISGCYAVGEAAGFGGGGIHGKGSLEGTFLGSCVLTALRAASHISSSN